MVNATGITADGPITNLPFVGPSYTIVAPLLRLATTSVRQTGECLGPEERVAVETTITNGSAARQVVTFTLRLPHGLEKVSGSCSPGMVGCDGAGSGPSATLVWSGEVAAGGTVRLVYQLRVSPTVSTGERLCLMAEATAGGVATGAVPHCLVLTCPSPGPGILPPSTRVGGGQFAGSVLFFNLYHSAAGGRPDQESRIALTNTHPTSPVSVHLFFVDGTTGGVAQQSVSLSPNQTVSFLAGEIDPGVTGSLLAVAVDSRGCPRRFNHLIGEVAVRFEGGAAAHLGAIGIPALATGATLCAVDAATVQLKFDGRMYAPFGRTLAVSGLGASADGQQSQRLWLVINRLGGALGEGGSTRGEALFGLLYDDREVGASFQVAMNGTQLRGLLGNHFPRTSPRYDRLIPAGRAGWMRLSTVDDTGISGVLLTDSIAGFRHGHNLHVLTLTHSVVYEMPLLPVHGPSGA
jgi:hypothetical protein